MSDKSIYICPICGESFSDIDKYAEHFNTCNIKRKAEAARVENERLEKEKETRLAELNRAKKHYEELLEKYLDDYKEFSYTISDGFSRLIDRLFFT